MPGARRFDVIVVGAGPAGCVLANRLSADSARHVLLIEAGPDYGGDPTQWPDDLRDPTTIWPESHPWGYLHAGRPAERPLPLARAKVIGGSSTINACFWLRGSAADYDRWAALGNPGWSFDDLVPYFRRSESDPLGGPLHGTMGPVPVFRPTEDMLNPVDMAFISAVEATGLPRVADVNGDQVQRPGVGPLPKNVTDGVRMNAAFTYLAPARHRPNLTILPHVEVERLIIDNRRTIGVRTTDGQQYLGAETVLCAGAFGSPVILLRSGIGPAADLRALGIPIVVDRAGVGLGLLDHPFLISSRRLTVWPLLPERAPATGSFVPILVKLRSQTATDEIDLHFYPGQAFNADLGQWELTVSISLMDARSRGSLKLASPHPGVPPIIDHAYFSEQRDLEALCDGMEFLLELMTQPAITRMVAPDHAPVPAWQDRDSLRSLVTANVSTTWHPSGTCQMGPADDPTAVVDHVGQVHGVSGLRVADAAIFPAVLRANLHCTVVAAAEKLADAITHRDIA